MGGRRNKTFSKGAAKGLAQLSLSKALIEGAQLREGEDSLPVKPWKRLAPAFWAAILTAGEVGTLGWNQRCEF